MKVLNLIIAIGVLGSLQVQAQAPQAAATCIGCHGVNGISPNPLWPNLAGQKMEYLAKQLNLFKTGARQDPMMNPLAQSLSDKDIADLSLYFSKLGSK